MGDITPPEAKRIAEEAYIFAFSMLENYKTMYAQAVNENLPTFRAPFNQFNHWRQLLGTEFTEIVAPNNDTLYSMAWLDLGTEPSRLSEHPGHLLVSPPQLLGLSGSCDLDPSPNQGAL